MIASDIGHTDVVRVLVEAGADLNLVDKVRKYFDYKIMWSNSNFFITFDIYYRITEQRW